MDKLTDIFCDVDDFCNVFIPQWELQLLNDGTKKRRRSSRMRPSEIMTIIISFHISHHRDFKNYYTGYWTVTNLCSTPQKGTLSRVPNR